MSDLSHFWWQSGKSGPDPSQIGSSLRFRGAQYLQRTVGSAPTDGKKYTISLWVKRGKIDASYSAILGSKDAGGFNGIQLRFMDDYSLDWSDVTSALVYQKGTSQLFRDPSAWYNITVTLDSTDATAANRAKLYVNGVRVTSFNSAHNVDPGSNITNNWTKNGATQAFGRPGNLAATPFEGYLAEVHSVDGQALDPTTFGEFNADGVWVPKKVSGVTYGTNGFYLDFSDPANIGADRSGNNNDFTPTGFELTTTTSTNYDWMADSPTKNAATLNPLRFTYLKAKNANLTCDSTDRTANYTNTILGGVGVSSGKWYYEATVNSGAMQIGIAKAGVNLDYFLGVDSRGWGWRNSGDAWNNNVSKPYGAAYTTGDVIGCALDVDAGTLEFYKNGASQGVAFTGLSGEFFPGIGDASSGDSVVASVNYGQLPFRYTPPAGYVGWTTENLPAVAITKPSDHFTTILDTGANILTAAKAKFPNGLWWIKDRTGSNQHQLVDSVRGGNLAVPCPSVAAEAAYAAPAGNSVAWCWKAGGAPVANTNGTLPSQVSANQDAGFSIVSYTGGASGSTVGHGLSKAPQMMFFRNRDNGSQDWLVWREGLSSTQGLNLNNADPQFNSGSSTFISDVGATTFRIGNSRTVNNGTDKIIAYCWHSVPGYSAFGSYVGNSSDDGPFIYTGFRVGWLMVKPDTAGTNWCIVDAARSTYNPTIGWLIPNAPDSEPPASLGVDFLSNGFKIRATGNPNNSGVSILYMAFAESPFGGSNVSPAPAR
jgi:hypothetical protein